MKSRRVGITESLRNEILEYYDYECQYCHGYGNIVDHIIPQAYMIDNRKINLVCSCMLCNLVASDKVFDSFDDKRRYILNKRKRILSKPITIWKRSELSTFSHKLRKEIERSCIILNTDEEIQRALNILKDIGLQGVAYYKKT